MKNIDNKNKYYVYEWYIKNTDEVFYVGKGSGKRAWQLKENSYFLKMYNTHNCDVRIIINNLTEDEAFNKEIDTISYYRNNTNCRLTNVADGGNQPPLRYGENSCSKLPKVKAKMKKKALDRWQDKEYRNKCELSFKAFWNTKQGKQIASQRSKINMNDEKIRDKIRQANINYYQDEIHRQEQSERMKRCYNNEACIKSHYKKIVQLDKDYNYINKYNSLIEAEKETGVKFRGISKVLRGNCKTYGGFIWVYYEDYIKQQLIHNKSLGQVI